ncbi:MAG: hypothetical protein ACRENI_06845 [Gemmatimonadaceae bacterium]
MMKHRRQLATAIVAAGLTACGGSSGSSIGQVTPRIPPPSPAVIIASWSASLRPVGGSGVTGSAALRETSDRTVADISVSGASANDLLPWHVHSGSCNSTGAIVGSEAPYAFLVTTPDGAASLSIGLPANLLGGGSYYVDVHRSQSDPGPVIACGNLTRG